MTLNGLFENVSVFRARHEKTVCILAIFGDLLEGCHQKFSGSLSLAIFSGPLNILVVIRALRILIMQCNAMSITEAGQRPLFQTLSKNKIIKHRIDSRIKLYYTSGHKSLSSK